MTVETPDIDDTLRETYASLRGSFEGDFSEEASAQVPTVEEDLETETPIGEETPAGTPTEEDDANAEGGDGDGVETPEKPAQHIFKPPWKKAALAEWEKLPDGVRAEIERREGDFHKGIEQYKTNASMAQEWDRTVQPFMATIKSLGVTPQFAAAELLKADHLLRYSQPDQKVGMLLKIAKDYGVDIGAMAHGIQRIAGEQIWQQQNPVDPRVQQLQAEIGQMKQQQFQAQQNHVAQETSVIDGEIAAFAADPDHEHFGILQRDMAVLLQAGSAKSLDDAYEMAMRQNPQTYQIWLAQQQQEWDVKRKAKVAEAKRAGANNARPNGRTSMPASQPKRSMEEDIEATARELGLLN